MNLTNIEKLKRDLIFVVKMIALAAEKNDKEAVVRYVNSAGNLLNKITEEATK